MTKHELDQLVFWYQERQELIKFRDALNHCSEANLITTNTKTWSVIITSFSHTFKDKYKADREALADIYKPTLKADLCIMDEFAFDPQEESEET